MPPPGDAEAAGPWSTLLRVTTEEFSIMWGCCNVFILSTVDGHLWLDHLGAIINNSSVNFLVHITCSQYVNTFLLGPWELLGYRVYIYSEWGRSCQQVSQSSWTNLYSQEQKVFETSCNLQDLHQHLGLGRAFKCLPICWRWVISHCGFNFHFLMTNEVRPLICLLGILSYEVLSSFCPFF